MGARLDVARALGLGEADGAMIEAARRRHEAPQRRYHDWSHVEALAGGVAGGLLPFADRRAVALFVLYHDAIYDPRSATNEADSAALLLAERRGREEAGTLDLAAAVVRATAGHRLPDDLTGTDRSDAAACLDLDLAILALPARSYDAYAEKIRREYAHVPDEAWRAGRAMVLEGFTARERLYLTEVGFALWEAPARAYVARELSALRGL